MRRFGGVIADAAMSGQAMPGLPLTPLSAGSFSLRGLITR
jgi:hypothetical protein